MKPTDGGGLRITRTLHAGQVWGVILESNGGPPRRLHSDDMHRLHDETVEFWRQLAVRLDLPGALARDGGPLGADPQAHDLRADRRHRGRPDRRAAGAGRRRAELGLPVHLDSGRLVLDLRAARPRLHRGGDGVRRLAPRPGGRAGGRRLRAAEDHVPGRRQLRPDRGHARPFRGLARLPPGADRQRRRRPASARHLRRDDGRDVPRRPDAACRPATRTGWRSPA